MTVAPPSTSSPWNLDERAFEGHQGRQRRHLVLGHVEAEADSAFRWEAVVAVLGAICLDHLDPTVVELNRKSQVIHGVALAQLIEETGFEVRVACRLIELAKHAAEETRFVGHRPS